MKNTKLLLFTLLLIFKFSLSNGQNRFQGFEGTAGDTWGYTANPSAYNEAGGSDIWEPTGSVGSITSAATGSQFWGARDLENPGSGGAFPHTLTFTTIDLSTYNGPELSFKYHTDGFDGSDSLGYYVEFDNGNTWTNYTALNKSTQAWTTVKVTIPNNSTHVRIRFAVVQNGGSDYAAFDDVAVYSDPNTFQGFEGTANDNWNFTPTPATYNEASGSDIWEVSNSVGSINSAATGTQFWGCRDLENPGSGGAFPHTLDFDPIYVAGFSNVTLSFKYHTDGYDGSDSLGYYVEYDNGTTWTNYAALNKSTQAWTTVNITVPANSQFVRIRFAVVQNGGSDYAAFDDVVVTTTPPPANIAWDKDLVIGNEGDKLTGTINVTSANSTPISFDVELVNGFGTASGSDINNFTKQTINVPANTNGAYTFAIDATQDSDAEADEYFAVRITNPSNASINGDEFATFYIKDDDKKAPVAAGNIDLKHISSYLVGNPSNNSAEIIAFDKGSNRLFVANSTASAVEILDFSNPVNITPIKTVDISSFGAINSIAVKDGIVALAIEDAVPTLDGYIIFMDTDGNVISQVTAGALPDMITFTPDGKKVLAANEGEPETDYNTDPEGSITIVDISGGVASVTQANVTTANFTSFNSQLATLRSQGVRIYGPGSNVAQDLEPEYITVSTDSKTAWVICQENNALAVVDIDNSTVTSILPLGFKDHSLAENALDASDRSGEPLLGAWPVKGMYQPDAIASYSVGGKTYIVTANEGDAREYNAIEEEERVKDLKLDPAKFPFENLLKKDHNLGRLTAVTTIGDTDNDGDIDEIHVLGGRSFSIWDASTGSLVYDSKDDLERIIKEDPTFSAIFNATDDDIVAKNRSDNKGPEPEGVVVATINDSIYAFIGLERVGGVMTYNVTDPNNPIFVDYVNTRSTTTATGDLAPEGLLYIGENDSKNGKRYVIVANEVSATVSVFEVEGFTPSPKVEWRDEFLTANEGDKLQIALEVKGNNPNPSSFTVELINGFGTASSGDFDNFTPNTINVPANAPGIYTFDINTTQDGTAEADEYFAIRITNTNNIEVDGDDFMTLYIKDDDKKAPVAAKNLSLKKVGAYTTGDPGNGNSAEIVAYDEVSKRLFIANSTANSFDIVNFNNPASPVKIKTVDISSFGAINSIAVKNEIVALAIENNDKQQNGVVVFMDTDGNTISQVTAGALPDMVTFTHDGSKVLAANEGEPNDDYSNDPEGSITIIDISGGVANVSQANVTTASFTAFNAQEAALRASGVRIYGPNATVAKDLEPEYITISDDSKTAWVICQENNALAVVDIDNGTVTAVLPLGFKDHSLADNALDASDRSGEPLLANWPIKGMYQPDGIASFTTGGTTYVISANEGDAREYDTYEEEERVKDLKLDPTKFPFAEILQKNHNLGRMTAVNSLGDTDNDGDIDEIHVLGGRSFSIWNTNTGALVYDSKDDIERIIKEDPVFSAIFNSTDDDIKIKNRSDNKGPEPESVTTAVINDSIYAFIALERVGGVMTYNVTDPNNPIFVDYVNTKNTTSVGGDLAPEGIIYINEDNSPNGKRYVITANEVSATLAVFEVESFIPPASTVNFAGGALTVKETDGSRVLKINLMPQANYDGRIVVDVTNGAGTEYGIDKDYVLGQNPVGDSLVFDVKKGMSVINLTMSVVEDSVTENNETVTFNIRSVSNKLVLGATNTLTVTIENVVPNTGPNSIDELGREKLNIYPNPTNNGVINLSLESSGVINDINGKQVIEFTNTKTIDVTSLDKGVYILRTKSGVNARVVVQ